MSTEAYDQSQTGQGTAWADQRKERVACQICRKEVGCDSLQRHMMDIHQQKPEQYLYRERGTVGEFWVSVVRGEENRCPIPGCIGRGRK